MNRTSLATVALLAALGGCRQSEQEKFYARENQRYERMEAHGKLLKDSKAIILAAIKYSGDHDDVYPGPSDFKTKVAPYVKPEDREAFDRFVWIFPGGNIAAVDKPNKTEAGRLKGPDFDAVAYVDGSVRADPPNPVD